MKTPRFKNEKDAGNGWTVWVKPIMRGYLIACCDCALVHKMEYRIRGGRVWFRVRRAIGHTANLRKRERIVVRTQPRKKTGGIPAE